MSFKDRAEEAVNLYVGLIPNSRIVSVIRSEEEGPIARGKVVNAVFELDGREFAAMDGGDSFAFSEGFSISLTCEDQAEVDRIWAGLIANGGRPGPCGWLTDPFGLSWQVVPAALIQMMTEPQNGNTRAAVAAMLKMGKLDVAELRRAYETPTEGAP